MISDKKITFDYIKVFINIGRVFVTLCFAYVANNFVSINNTSLEVVWHYGGIYDFRTYIYFLIIIILFITWIGFEFRNELFSINHFLIYYIFFSMILALALTTSCVYIVEIEKYSTYVLIILSLVLILQPLGDFFIMYKDNQNKSNDSVIRKYVNSSLDKFSRSILIFILRLLSGLFFVSLAINYNSILNDSSEFTIVILSILFLLLGITCSIYSLLTLYRNTISLQKSK